MTENRLNSDFIDAKQLKRDCSQILHEVEHGQPVTILKDGVPVARLILFENDSQFEN